MPSLPRRLRRTLPPLVLAAFALLAAAGCGGATEPADPGSDLRGDWTGGARRSTGEHYGIVMHVTEDNGDSFAGSAVWTAEREGGGADTVTTRLYGSRAGRDQLNFLFGTDPVPALRQFSCTLLGGDARTCQGTGYARVSYGPDSYVYDVKMTLAR